MPTKWCVACLSGIVFWECEWILRDDYMWLGWCGRTTVDESTRIYWLLNDAECLKWNKTTTIYRCFFSLPSFLLVPFPIWKTCFRLVASYLQRKLLKPFGNKWVPPKRSLSKNRMNLGHRYYDVNDRFIDDQAGGLLCLNSGGNDVI